MKIKVSLDITVLYKNLFKKVCFYSIFKIIKVHQCLRCMVEDCSIFVMLNDNHVIFAIQGKDVRGNFCPTDEIVPREASVSPLHVSCC